MIHRGLLIFFSFCVFSALFPHHSFAFSLKNPEQTGLAVTMGSTYDPEPKFGFSQISMMALYDYEQIMPHRAPDPLRFKFEVSVGLTDHGEHRFLGSFNFFAHYTLDKFVTADFSPYVEAGAGLVYGDFQVKGQGLRMNFNPQAGIGSEWRLKSGQRYFGALRAYHISNGGLHGDNRGINGVLVQLGMFF